jgi:hypothetical protein
MATSMLTVDIAINSLLCFTVSKRSKIPEKNLKSIVLDYYSIDEVIAAKKQLISEIELFATNDASFPRFPARSGDKRFEREVSDIFALLTLIDEHNITSKLRRYVTDNCDRLPSLKLGDGDLRYMVAKMDKMAAMIEGLQASVNALFDINSQLSRSLGKPSVINKNSAVVSGASVAQPGSTVVNSSSMHWANAPASVYQSHRKQGAVASGSQTIRISNTQSKPTDLTSSWAEVPIVSTGDSCNDTDGFQVRESRRKRRRTRTRSLLPVDQSRTASNSSKNEGGSSTLLQSNSRTISNKRDSGQNNARKPLIIGKNAITSNGVNNNHNTTIVAARPLKAVFCVDNVSAVYGVSELCEFVVGLGVRVLSCFEVAPRYSCWQRVQFMKQQGEAAPLFRKAFRLCINQVDTVLLLRAEA